VAIRDPLRGLRGKGVVVITDAVGRRGADGSVSFRIEDNPPDEAVARFEHLLALDTGRRGRKHASLRAMNFVAQYLRQHPDMEIGVGNPSTPGFNKLGEGVGNSYELNWLAEMLQRWGIEIDGLEDLRNLVRRVRKLMQEGKL
jgi:hypothetical protein